MKRRCWEDKLQGARPSVFAAAPKPSRYIKTLHTTQSALLLSIVACCAWAASSAQQTNAVSAQQDATTLLQQGRLLASSGRLAEAEVPLVKAAALAPGDARILSLLAQVKSRLGETDDAVQLFRRVVVVEPHSAEAHLNLAIALADIPDAQGALIEVEKALQLNPTSSRAHLNRARLLADTGQTLKARTEFQRAAQLKPNDPEIELFWGLLEKNDHRPEAAASLFSKIVAQQPENGRAYILLGQCLEITHHESQAIQAWEHAVALDPTSEEALYALAQAQRNTDPAAAAGTLDKFNHLHEQKQQTDRARELGNAAYAAMQQQAWSTAIATLQQAIKICEQCALLADLHQRLGLAQCHQGDIEIGERELRIALSMKPNDRQTVEALQWVDKEKKRKGISQ